MAVFEHGFNMETFNQSILIQLLGWVSDVPTRNIFIAVVDELSPEISEYR